MARHGSELLLTVWIAACGSAGQALDASVAPVRVSGFELSPDQNLDAPVMWPSGGNGRLAQTELGTLLALQHSGWSEVVPLFSDGGMGPATRLGLVRNVRLIPSAVGIVALYQLERPDPSGWLVFSRLLDPTSGAFLGREVALPSANEVTGATGAPGRLLLLSTSLDPDGGLRHVLRRLSDEGHDLGDHGVDISQRRLLGLITAHVAHWGLFAVQGDGGYQYEIDRLADDGTPSLLAVIPLAPRPQPLPAVFTATDSRLFGAWNDGDRLHYFFVSPAGQITRGGDIDAGCASLAASGRGDEVWLSCVPRTVVGWPNELVMITLSEVSGPSSARAIARDDGGGAIVAGPITSLGSPVQFFERQHNLEVSRHARASTYVLPLDPSGLAAAAPPAPARLLASSQLRVGFATVGPSGPHALLWYDAQQFTTAPMLRGAMFSASGEVQPPQWMGTVRLLDSVGATAPLQRSAASNGVDFMVVDSDSFETYAAYWPSDAGAVGSAVRLTTRRNLIGPRSVCGDNSGFFVTWYAANGGRIVQRVDASGTRILVPPMSLSGDAFFEADLLCEGDGALLAAGGAGALSLMWLSPSGAVRDAGTITTGKRAMRVLLARSGPVGLVVWEERDPQNPTAHKVFAQRLRLDGGALLDAPPWQVDVSAPTEYSRTLGDVGSREGIFYVMGTEAADAGDTLWLWQVSASEAPRVVFSDVRGVVDVAVGPALTDGGLLFAYVRAHAELDEASRVHYRVLGGAYAPEPDAGHPPLLIAVGCGCQNADGGSSWVLVLMGWGLSRRRRPPFQGRVLAEQGMALHGPGLFSSTP